MMAIMMMMIIIMMAIMMMMIIMMAIMMTMITIMKRITIYCISFLKHSLVKGKQPPQFHFAIALTTASGSNILHNQCRIHTMNSD